MFCYSVSVLAIFTAQVSFSSGHYVDIDVRNQYVVLLRLRANGLFDERGRSVGAIDGCEIHECLAIGDGESGSVSCLACCPRGEAATAEVVIDHHTRSYRMT